jgi:hypothetical protein
MFRNSTSVAKVSMRDAGARLVDGPLKVFVQTWARREYEAMVGQHYPPPIEDPSPFPSII